jgi:hypothetical protein
MRRPLFAVAALVLAILGVVLFQLIGPRSNMLFPPRASNGVDYVLYIHVPQACENGGCDALYLLDGLAWLPTFARHADEIAAQGRMAPLVIVGIGYRNAFDTGDLRKHDFTPAFGRTPGETGGADAFISVLRDELIPYAEQALPIRTDARGLAGHSYAGLFTAYAFAREPGLFDRTLIMSPALWYDGNEMFNETFVPSLYSRAVFVAAETPRGEERSDVASDTLRLFDVMMSQGNVTGSRALIVGKSHNGMVDPAARRGLIALYGESAQ